MEDNIFSFVKNNVKLSDFVKTLPTLTSITPVGGGKWRCNNVIAGGGNPTSMVVDDQSGFFKAFSHDQEHGDVITLYQLTMGDSTGSVAQQAAQLANHMGIAVDEKLLHSTHGVSSRDLVEALNTITNRAHRYLYSDNPDARTMLDYLYDRGATDELIKQWSLGAFPSNTRDMSRITEGFSTEILQKTGIVSQKNKHFIAMMGRIVFPIFSPAGDTISFSSRAIDGVQTPLPGSKYINTSTTAIYDKSVTLYGQHLVDKNTTTVLICEGNMDVMALNAIAPDNTVAVATCGTALTPGHVSKLGSRKNITNVSIVFDQDDTGKDAASQCLWLHNHWDDVRYIALPGGKDPWDAYVHGMNDSSLERLSQPLMMAATQHKFNTLKRNDFLTWCANAQATLNFSDDREIFFTDVYNIAGVKRTHIVSSAGHSMEPYRPSGESSNSLGDTLKEMIPPLLAMNSTTRKIVASPLLAKPSREYASSVCGLDEKDYQVITAIIANKRHGVDKESLAEAYSLYPEQDEDSYDYRFFARFLARSLMFSWRYDQTHPPVVAYIPLVQAIASGASGADGLDQVSFIFEAIAATADQR